MKSVVIYTDQIFQSRMYQNNRQLFNWLWVHGLKEKQFGCVSHSHRHKSITRKNYPFGENCVHITVFYASLGQQDITYAYTGVSRGNC